MIDYVEFLVDNLEPAINYSEYISENLKKNVAYSEYIAQSLGNYSNGSAGVSGTCGEMGICGISGTCGVSGVSGTCGNREFLGHSRITGEPIFKDYHKIYKPKLPILKDLELIPINKNKKPIKIQNSELYGTFMNLNTHMLYEKEIF